MAQPTTKDLQTPEYLTARDLSDQLRIGIQNDLEGIVTKVYSAGIISANARDEIIDPATHESSSRRTRKFITMLEDKIQIDPECLAHFRGLLAEEPAHRSLVDMIGELASYPPKLSIIRLALELVSWCLFPPHTLIDRKLEKFKTTRINTQHKQAKERRLAC